MQIHIYISRPPHASQVAQTLGALLHQNPQSETVNPEPAPQTPMHGISKYETLIPGHVCLMGGATLGCATEVPIRFRVIFKITWLVRCLERPPIPAQTPNPNGRFQNTRTVESQTTAYPNPNPNPEQSNLKDSTRNPVPLSSKSCTHQTVKARFWP